MDISIKKPCHENWEDMTPNEQGAFCHKCVKSVVDFSEKTIEEIKEFFSKKTEGRVCGRFREDQMSELSFDAFFDRFRSFQLTKKMAIVLYFTFGMWLFGPSAACAQEVHVKGDVAVEKPVTKKGKVKVVNNDTTKCIKTPKQVGISTVTKDDDIIMGKVAAPQEVNKDPKEKPKKTPDNRHKPINNPPMKTGEIKATPGTKEK
jgi:hypothetical protein